MLSKPSSATAAVLPAATFFPAATVLLGLLAGAPAPAQAEGTTTTQPAAAPAPQAPASPSDRPPPPPDLVVLVDKVGLKGHYVLGVFGRTADPVQPRVWRLKLWEQTDDRVYVSTDVLDCSPTQPMRITGSSRSGGGPLILRELNPGGLITPANRFDHQVWWAACFPELAGRDPATLGAEARRLGYSGTLLEREQVVPRSPRP